MPKVDDYGAWLAPTPKLKIAFPVTPPSQRPTGTNAGLPPGVGGGGGGGGNQYGPIQVGAVTPDYKSLIKADPGYMAWDANRTKSIGNLSSDRTAAIKELVRRFGGLPPGFTDAYGDITASDLELAKNNPMSEEAQLQHQYAQNVQGMKQQLAARGALQSGELGYGQGQVDYGNAQAEYSLGNSFLDALTNAVTGYTHGVDDINSGESGAIGQAQSNVQQLYPSTPSHAADYEAGSNEKYGFPVYKDTDGKLWKMGANGPELFAPPSAPSPIAGQPGGPVATPFPVTHPARPTAPPIISSPAGPYAQVVGGKKYE